MSDTDIAAGTRWEDVLSTSLRRCQFGIICLTPENVDSQWLTFEAGAMSTSFASGRVVPVLFELKPVALRFPLAQFQHISATRKGMRSLIGSINELSPNPESTSNLDLAIEQWWPKLSANLSHVPPAVSGRRGRTDRDLLEEIVDLVREAGHPRRSAHLTFHERGKYRIRKRINDLTDSDLKCIVTDDLGLIKEQITEKLSRTADENEEEHLQELYDMAHGELSRRAGNVEIDRLGTPELVAFIDEAIGKLRDVSLPDAEREVVEARIAIAEEERARRSKYRYGPRL